MGVHRERWGEGGRQKTESVHTFTTTDMPLVDKIIQHGEAVECQSFVHNNLLISDFCIRVYITT